MVDRDYLVDGVSLMDAAGRWGVLLRSAPNPPAQQRVAKLVLPRISGVRKLKRQGFNEGRLSLRLVVRSTPTGPVEQHFEVLAGVLARAEAVSKKVGTKTLAADVIEVLVSDPERVSLDYWRVEVVFTVAPFWWETFGGEAFEVGPGLLAVRRRVSNG